MPYNRQVILNLQSPSKEEDPSVYPRRSGSAEMLTEKAKRRNIPSTTILLNNDKNLTDAKYQPLQALNNLSRIYIIGHGSKSKHNIIRGTDSNEQDVEWTAEEIANLIAKNRAPKTVSNHPYIDIENDTPVRLTISLVQCYSGYEDDNFATQLSNELYNKHGIVADIHGRNGVTSRFDGVRYEKRVKGYHQQPDSKKVYTRDAKGKLVIKTVDYETLQQRKFLAKYTGINANEFSLKDRTNLTTEYYDKSSGFGQIAESLNSQFKGIKFRVEEHFFEMDRFRLSISLKQITDYLKTNNLWVDPQEENTIAIESDDDIIKILNLITDIDTWIPRGESEFVSDTTDSKEDLQKIAKKVKFQYPSLEVHVRETRSVENKGKHRLVIRYNNMMLLLNELKIEQQKHIIDVLEKIKSSSPAAYKTLSKISLDYFHRTFLERKEGHKEFVESMNKALFNYEVSFDSEEQYKKFARELNEGMEAIVFTQDALRESTRNISKILSQRTLKESTKPTLELLEEKPTPKIKVEKQEIEEPLRKKPSAVWAVPLKKNQVLEDEKTKLKKAKRDFLQDLVNGSLGYAGINDASWNKKGRNWLGMWRITPEGIQQLRNGLKDFPTLRKDDYISVETIFEAVAFFLEKKQTPYKGPGKRLEDTQKFYKDMYHKILEIRGELAINTDEKQPLLLT